MARNEEKAQSMLYRFREAQAAELGLGTRADRRPRMASACKSLRDCERWRGEILREIGRKVSKIQDAGLTDYEVRDLNDEINKLIREKRHWENQIVALGGANYRRNVAMLDDDGKEVPGTKGYKYFGRAKDLPGVKELFQSRKKEEEEENQALSYYKKFMTQGPAYYGDLDELDGQLLAFETKGEEEEWNEAYSNLHESLGLPASEPIPTMPRSPRVPQTVHPSIVQQQTPPVPAPGKRKHPDDGGGEDDDVEMSTTDSDQPTQDVLSESTKRSKAQTNGTTGPPGDSSTVSDIVLQHAQAAAAYITFLDVDDLLPPKIPSREEMEQVLLGLRKKMLMDEYFGDEGRKVQG